MFSEKFSIRIDRYGTIFRAFFAKKKHVRENFFKKRQKKTDAFPASVIRKTNHGFNSLLWLLLPRRVYAGNIPHCD